MPTTRDKRTTSFGHGYRTDFTKRDTSPPPNIYKLPSDFDKKKEKGLSFGISREAYAKVYHEVQPSNDQSVPGPGQYPAKNFIGGNEGCKFSFRPKTKIPSCNL